MMKTQLDKEQQIIDLRTLAMSEDTDISEMDLWEKCHYLAEEKFPGAKEVFISMLDNRSKESGMLVCGC